LDDKIQIDDDMEGVRETDLKNKDDDEDTEQQHMELTTSYDAQITSGALHGYCSECEGTCPFASHWWLLWTFGAQIISPSMTRLI
jgi:hypothetical protein